MGSISVPTAILGAGALSAGTSLAGGLMSSNAATQAAQIQAAAANNASAAQLAMFNTIQGNLSPYMGLGTQGLNYLLGSPGQAPLGMGDQSLLSQNTSTGINSVALGTGGGGGTIYNVPESLGPTWTPTSPGVSATGTYTPSAATTGLLPQIEGITTGEAGVAQNILNNYGTNFASPFQPTMAQLEATPGYQFTLGQGLQATQNSYAAQGLGSSGAALKGAAQYAEGLASTTYQQQFNNYLAQNAQAYNMMQGLTAGSLSPTQWLTGTGQNAAAQLGAFGTQATSLSNQLLTSGAAASAAGTVGSANAITNALGGVGSAGTNTALLYALNQGGLFGTGGGGGGGLTVGGGVINPLTGAPVQ